MFNVSNIKVYFQIARRQHYTAEKSKPVFPGFMLFLALVCQNCTFWRWENGTEQDSSVHLQLQTIRLLQSYSNQGLKHWHVEISPQPKILSYETFESDSFICWWSNNIRMPFLDPIFICNPFTALYSLLFSRLQLWFDFLTRKLRERSCVPLKVNGSAAVQVIYREKDDLVL